MLGLKQQIPNGRSQERPRREETRSGEECPQEVDELRMRNNLTGDVVGRSWKKEKEGCGRGRERRGLFFAWASSNWSRTSIFAIFGVNAQPLTKDESRSYG
jgi:hypothetical protein